MKQLIENRILRLNEEKISCLELLEESRFDSEYIELRICYINERMRELQDLLDDINYMENKNE